MPKLREALVDAGFGDVKTYLQSGNVVLSSGASPDTVARKARRLIGDRFGLDIDVVVRTRDELAKAVRRNPLGDVAKDPKRYQVSFLSTKPDSKVVGKLEALAAGGERLVASGQELYAWAPERRRPLEAVGGPGGPRAGGHRNRPQLDDGDEAAGAGRRAGRIVAARLYDASDADDTPVESRGEAGRRDPPQRRARLRCSDQICKARSPGNVGAVSAPPALGRLSRPVVT